jgi:hypothetical protein
VIDSISRGKGIGVVKEMIAREAVQIQPTRIRRKHTKPGYKNAFYPKHVAFHVV